MLDPAQLRIGRVDDLVVVHLDGEVDMGNADRLVRRVLHALQELDSNGRAVVLDLTGLTYLDSSGLRMLEQIRHSLVPSGRPIFTVAPPTCRAHRLLTLTGLSEHLSTVDDLDAVVRELAAGSADAT